jgi:tRNA (guanine37-N1)-methyltransferase
MTFKLLTIFPEIFDSYLKEGIIKKAIERKIIKVNSYNLRDFSKDKHKKVDDSPYGGGAGMLMNIEPICLALDNLKKKNPNKKKKTILLSASGKKWNQALAKKYSKYEELILVCGRYEGVDYRVKNFIDQEISVGDYILSGGELPALIILDSITRLLPNTLGNKESLLEESHNFSGILEYPQYTRPEIFEFKKRKYKVPKILLSGNHQKIKKWQENKLKKRCK